MHCSYCEKNNPFEAIFCMQCGKQIKTMDHSEPSPSVQSVGPSSPGWIGRVAVSLSVFIWAIFAGIILWGISHIGRSLILLAIAALLAFALAPVIKIVERRIPRQTPRWVPIVAVYIVVFGILSVVIYFILKTVIVEVRELSGEAEQVFSSQGGGSSSSLLATLKSWGFDNSQIEAGRQFIVGQLSGLATDILPLLRGILDFILDFVLVAILSIYFLLDGLRVTGWLSGGMPLRTQKHIRFLMKTLEEVVGGYLKSQFLLSFIIGFLIFLGMAVLQVPHPIILGEFAFLMEFIPVVGVPISGIVCVLLSLTQNQGWVIAWTHQNWVLPLCVIGYIVVIHIAETTRLSPLIVGKTVKLHPIISVAGLIAGADLFGIVGALFAAPFLGVLQTIVISLWQEWHNKYPEHFPARNEVAETEAFAVSSASETSMETTIPPEPFIA